MLNEDEKKYLSASRLSIKIHYVEFETDYNNDDIFYYYGDGLIISTINSETYIDRKIYTDDKLINLLNSIFSSIDTNEIVMSEELFDIDIINKTFFNLSCKVITIDGDKKISIEQLKAINDCTDIKELKVPDFEKNIENYKFNFKIIPKIDNKFTSEKFKKFHIDDILRLKVLNIELPLKEDYIDESGQSISENIDLQRIIDVLVDIDSLNLIILDNGEESIKQSIDIIEKIEISIGSKIENICFVIGNRDVSNIEILKKIELEHKLAIMYDKEIICSIDDFINMREHINKLLNLIKKFELSPLEQTLYMYDTLKDFYLVNKKYIKEKRASRLIHRIFKNNDLNCQAYATLYAELLRELKIDATDYFLYSPLSEELFLTKNNHARTLIHLVDDKYKIDGLFSTDVVWDAIKKEKNNYHYEFFLTRIINIKRQFSTDKFNNDIEVLLGEKNLSDLSIKEKQVFERLLNKNKITEENIDYLREISKNNISLKTFIHALSSVRVSQGRDKDSIKEELIGIVNKTNKKEKYVDNYYNIDDDLSYLDITLPN